MADNQKQEKDKMAVNSIDNHKGEEGKRSDISPDEVDHAAVMNVQRKMSTDIYPKKKSSFQITSVSTLKYGGRRVERDLTGEDHDMDSLDDLDESHTDDISSSDILDMSKTTDIDPDPSSDQDAFHNLTEGEESSKVENQPHIQKNESVPNLQTAVQANLSRFKVVKIESKEPFRRGRWTCLDFLDPHEKGESSNTKVETENANIGSGNSSAASSIHYIPGVDDPSKNPLLEMGSNLITENHQIIEPMPVYANQIPESAGAVPVVDYDYGNPLQQQQQLVPDVTAMHPQTIGLKSEQNGHLAHSTSDISHPTATSQSQDYAAQHKGQNVQTNSKLSDQVLGIASVVPNSALSPVESMQSGLESKIHHGVPGLMQEGVSAVSQEHQAQINLNRLTSPDQQQQQQHTQPPGLMNMYPGDVSQMPEQLVDKYVTLEPDPNIPNHRNLQNEYASNQMQHRDYSQTQIQTQIQNVEYSQAQLQNEYSQAQQLHAEYSQAHIQNEYTAQLSKEYQTSQLTSEYPAAAQIHNPYSHQNDFQTQQHLHTDFQTQAQHLGGDYQVQTQQHLQSEYHTHPELGQGHTELVVNPHVDLHSKVTAVASAVDPSLVDTIHIRTNIETDPEQKNLLSSNKNKKSSRDNVVSHIVDEGAGNNFQSDDKFVYGSRPDSISIKDHKLGDPESNRAKDNAAQTLLTPPLLEIVSASIQPSLASPSKDEGSESGASTVAIDNKIEQAMDLVKSHLMFAVREEVEVLKEQIKELIEKNSILEAENSILKKAASAETLSRLSKASSKSSQTPTTASS